MMAEDPQQNNIAENDLPQEMVETTDLPPDSPIYQDLQEQRRDAASGEAEPRILKISCHACGQKLDLTYFPAFSRVKCPACETELIVPKWFDNYLLEEAGGEGGMATVYRALDLALDREVAIKVLNPELGSQQEKSELFLHEARTAATINHYAVVPIYTCGIFEGQTYIVMQFMSGGSLEDLLNKTSEPLPLAHVVSWIRDTAAGLANACEHGVVHHDIKPGNIMLDQEGKAKICDFGIAQIVSGNKVDSATELTSCWVSPHYVSPEKIVSGTEDYRGDIYSLGATFYHLVTGYTPFTENDVDELLRLRVNNDPMAPQHHRKDLPESLSDLILSMMSRDPEKRPSYATILSVLDKYLAHPVSAARPAAKRAPGAAGAKRPAAPRRPAGNSNVATELARKQAARRKAAASPAVMTMKIISTILTIVTIFAVGVWLLNETGNLDNHIGSLPRFMQKDKKETKAEKKLNTKILNCFQSGLSADAQMESEKILNDPAKDSSGYKNQAMLQAAFAAYLNTDLREIKDGTRQKTGKQYTEVLAAERENSMTDLDKIRAQDNYQLLQYLAGTYGVGELEDNDLHFTRGDDFGTKRAMADFLLFLTESDQPAADEIEPFFNNLKEELEKCKASWLYDAFMDRLPYWEQALFSGNGKIEEIEPLFRSFIKEDRKWGFDQAEKKHKFSSVPQKKAVVQLTEKGEVIGGPTISMERLKDTFESSYAPLERPQPKNPPLPYEFFFTKRRSGDYIGMLQDLNPHIRVAEARRLNEIQKSEQYLRDLTEKETIDVGDIQLSRVENRRRVLDTYKQAKLSFNEFNIKVAYKIIDEETDDEQDAHATLDWNCFPADQMLKILMAAAEHRNAKPKKTLEDDGKKGVELDELERATAWLYAAHWAHWYGDLDTVLNILKKIQLDTMGNNPRVNQEIEYYFLKPLVQKKEKTGDEE